MARSVVVQKFNMEVTYRRYDIERRNRDLPGRLRAYGRTLPCSFDGRDTFSKFGPNRTSASQTLKTWRGRDGMILAGDSRIQRVATQIN